MVYDKNGNQLSNIYDANATDLDKGYDKAGNVIFEKTNKARLKSYKMFYPDDAPTQYEIVGRQYDYFNMSADTFLGLYYDDYLANPPQGVTVSKRSLGKDTSNQFDIWEYDFNPATAQRTILLISGEHAYETTAQFGLAHLIRHIYRVQDNDAFEYIRKYVRVKVIPIMNPWGVNQYPREYAVYGGTNPERNFNYNGLWEMFTQSHDGGQAGDRWNKKGDYPFQVAETRTLAKWTMDNQDADFYINCHTGEDSGNRDLWIDYMTQTANASAILSALEKNKAIFISKFGQIPRVEVTGTAYPNETGYGMHGAFDMYCVRATGLWLEQSPFNTIFGDGHNVCKGAIDNYASVLCTNILEMLLDKYQSIYDALHPDDSTPITAVDCENVSLVASDYSKTVTLTMTPSDTSQFTFEWVSSDPSVCEVWGCTDQAVIVKRGAGTATVTVTNKLNPSVATSFTVTASQLT